MSKADGRVDCLKQSPETSENKFCKSNIQMQEISKHSKA